MALEEHQPQLHNPMFSLDALYCEEEHFGVDSEESEAEHRDENAKTPLAHDLFWEDDELASLISKEKEAHLGAMDLDSNGSVRAARREAVEWMLRVNAHYGFTAMTTVLAINYFDRFLSTHCFQIKIPWMSQLAAVACLSIAAKVEETQVPLLLDLQVEDAKYVFEAKIIQRMELLVLSSLQWKMHPVTPLSFIDHITRRLGLKSSLHSEFMWKCERLILSVTVDIRSLNYPPSVLAMATMLHVIKEVDPYCALDYQNQLMDLLNLSKELVDDCYNLIQEVSAGYGLKHSPNHKRKHQSIPGSPSGVIDAYFSCDSSNDSWVATSSVSSSPEPLFKKSRAQEQQMRLVPLKHQSVGVLGGSH